MKSASRLIALLAAVAVLGLAVASAARSRSLTPTAAPNPATSIDVSASMPASVKSTLHRACFDCHSEETRWPWYSTLPPMSWLIEGDVNQGRSMMNFSQWARYSARDRGYLLDRSCELATTREMPLWQYRMAHREARLPDGAITALCDWMRAESMRVSTEGRQP